MTNLRRTTLSVFAGALLLGVALAQSTADTQGSASAAASATQDTSASIAQTQASATHQVAAGTAFRADLTKSVDAHKAKVGDEVTAKAAQDVKSAGQVIVPKGSKIIGHVTQVQSQAAGDSQSAVGIAFDHAILKNGSVVPMNATIQAIASAQSAAAASSDSMMEPMASPMGSPSAVPQRSSPGLVGTAGSSTGAVVRNTVGTTGGLGSTASGTVNGTATGAAGPISGNGQLSNSAQGVVGLSGIALNAGSQHDSVISSPKGNVKLDGGTQMVLVVSPQ